MCCVVAQARVSRIVHHWDRRNSKAGCQCRMCDCQQASGLAWRSGTGAGVVTRTMAHPGIVPSILVVRTGCLHWGVKTTEEKS